MVDRFRNYVDGRTLEVDTRTDTLASPWDGSEVAVVDQARPEDLEAALRAATRVAGSLARMPRHARAAALRRMAEAIRTQKERISGWIVDATGKPIRFARVEVDRAVTTFMLASEEATRPASELLPGDAVPGGDGYRLLVERFPTGPLAAIGPFNFPLNLLAHKVAPALAVGAPVIAKPPPQCPMPGLLLGELATAAGFPAGALSVLHAGPEISEALAKDGRIRHVSFTGSARVGWHLKTACPTQKVTLELGGNAAAVVHRDADLEWAIERCVLGSFGSAGQVCIRVQRIFVHVDVYREFLDTFLLKTASLPGPDPRDPKSVYGPLIDRRNAERVMDWVRRAVEAGATLRCGGRREGAVVSPTVLTGVPAGQPCRDDEIFGPVTVIEPYVEWEEVLERVNDSVFGLQAGVFTRDLDRAFQAFEALEVGGVIVNDYPTFRLDHFPYGGVKASGIGREGVRYAMADLTEPRVMAIRQS